MGKPKYTQTLDIPIQGKMLIAAVGTRWCQHREEMINTCTYSEMRILQLILSGTLANAGRPERVINKQTSMKMAIKSQQRRSGYFFDQ
jgi:hypothetical protein